MSQFDHDPAATDLDETPEAPSLGLAPTPDDETETTSAREAADDGDADDGDDEGEGSGSTSGGPKATAARASRVQVRRVANKAQEVTEADAVTRSVAASLLGSSDGLADLTTAIMTAERGAAQPISDLHAIAEADPFEAAYVAGALGRDRMKAVWRLLAAFDCAPSVTMPASTPKAALELAKHVIKGLDFAALSGDLTPVATLLRKN